MLLGCFLVEEGFSNFNLSHPYRIRITSLHPHLKYVTMTESSSFKSIYSYEPFTATMAGFILPIFTALLSAFSSGLILYIISKSHEKLSITHHRIMAFMSMFDIISSIFIALGTIMMPSDSMYQLAGPMLGNQVTCQIRGWLTGFSVIGATASNACLSLYFVIKIVFNVEATKVRYRLEPVMCGYTLFLACFVPTFYLSKDLIHPNPFDGVCNVIPYPESCDEQRWYDFSMCVWDEDVLNEYTSSIILFEIVLGVHFGFIVISMCIVLWKATMLNREIKILDAALKATNTNDSSLDVNTPEAALPSFNGMTCRNDMLFFMRDLRYDRIFVLQAVMYVFAYMLTWMVTFGSNTLYIANIQLDIADSILYPLQGLWNLFIFLIDKAYHLRQIDESMTCMQSVRKVLFSPSDVPALVLTNMPTTELIQSNRPPREAALQEQICESSVQELSLISVDIENEDTSLFRSIVQSSKDN
jgi:hypothetical protein